MGIQPALARGAGGYDPAMTVTPVLVLGVDGADHGIVTELLAAGRLPTLARLRDQGRFGPLVSTEPPITPVAWTTFLTGLLPGRHGIYNFSTNPYREGHRILSAADRDGAPIWRFLQAAGLRSVMVLVPFTYPLEPLNGVVVSGYGGPEQPDREPARGGRADRPHVPRPGVVRGTPCASATGRTSTASGAG